MKTSYLYIRNAVLKKTFFLVNQKNLVVIWVVLILGWSVNADAGKTIPKHKADRARHQKVSATASPSLVYAGPQTYTVGVPISPLTPASINVAPYGFAQDPVLLHQVLPLVALSDYGLVEDASGNLYMTNDKEVDKVAPDGTLTVIATGFNSLAEIALDASGNMYVADNGANLVIEIPAGGGTQTNIGTGINEPVGVVVDASGNVYVSEYANNDVKKIQAGTNTTTVFATGFSTPLGMALDAAGSLYVCDSGNNLIRKIRQDGGGTQTILCISGDVYTPAHVTIDHSGTLFVSAIDQQSFATSGQAFFYLLAGSTQPVFMTPSTGDLPFGITTDPWGNIYAAQGDGYGDNALIELTPAGGYFISSTLPTGLNFNGTTGTISGTPLVASPPTTYTITAYNISSDGDTSLTASATVNITVNTDTPPVVSYGSPQTYVINTPNTARPASTGGLISGVSYPAAAGTVGHGFNLPNGVAKSASGIVYVADRGTNTVKEITTGELGTTLILASGFNKPTGVAVDAAGDVYVADYGNNAVKKIPAGGGAVVTWGSGFSSPLGVAVDAAGNVYVADKGNNAVKRIATNGITTVSIGSGFNAPSGVAVDGAGNVYVADTGSGTIQEIPQGGTTHEVFSGFVNPFGVAVDASGNIFTVNEGDNTVYVNGHTGFAGSEFNSPEGICVDNAGNIYIADTGNNEIRTIAPLDGFFISSVLPAGMIFDSKLGIISGTPTALTAVTNYTVSAYNSAGSTTATFSAKVVNDGDVALLSNLSLSVGTLFPAFGNNTITYAASVGNANTSMTATPTATDASATIKVNGATVASGSPSAAIPLSVGANTLTTVVTATDGTTTNTYTVTVTRAPSSNATLAGIVLSSGTLSPAFSGGTTGYTATVNGATASITVKPTVADNTATVTVNGTAVTSGTASGAITLNLGANVITIVATAQDGSTTQTYTLTVTKLSNDATLTSITTSPSIPLVAISGPGYKNYTGSVPNTTVSVQIIPVTESASATVKVNGTTVATGAASQSIPLIAGDNVINTVVTAQDGTTDTYIITITRAPSSDANLGNLTISSGTLTPVFSTSTTSYTVAVSGSVSSITVTPTVADAATVKVNGTAVTSGTASGPITLSVGSNTISIVLTAQDGSTTKTYAITVTRAAASNIATLSKLTTSSGTLTPAFATATTSYTDVAHSVSSIAFRATTTDPLATETINGTAVPEGTVSYYVPLNAGVNNISIVVTAQDGVTKDTYTIAVTRLPEVATLSKLTVSSGTLSPAFATGTTSYTDVAHAVSSIAFRATTTDPLATETINGTAVPEGTVSFYTPLSVGVNNISIVVTAQDGVTMDTYTVAVTRLPEIATLSKLTVSSGTLSPVFAAATTSYTDVAHAVSSIAFRATTTDPLATETINGTAVPEGTVSFYTPLNVGSNTITIIVTAQDGVTTDTYTIAVTRLPEIATLSGLTISSGTLSPAFATATTSYTDNVANTISSIAFRATTTDASATETINGTAVPEGTVSFYVPLNVGANTITIIVTAQDGITTDTYTLAVTRVAPPGAKAVYQPVSVETTTETPRPENDGILVHQGVSPNGDGIDDFLQIDNITNYPDNRLAIMNRNSILVYEAKGYDNASRAFDGHSNKNGQMQLPGTYFYELDYVVDGIIKHKTGFLVLKY
jgi:gliding motility-associated-like protein